jgi:hypothetical protein
MKSILFIILLALSYSSLFSQTYEGEIILQDRNKIIADSIVIHSDFITFKLSRNNIVQKLENAEVRMIRVKDGNYALEGIGLGIVGGIALYFSAARYENISSEGTIYAAAVGSFIGLVIGVSTNRVNTIRINRKFEISLLNDSKFLPISLSSNLSLLNFQYKF